MSLGIIAALVGVLFFGVANTAMKFIANKYDNNFSALLWQYLFIVPVAAVFVAILTGIEGTAFFPVMTTTSWMVLAAVGVFGFIGIALLFEAFDHLSAGVTMTIANTAVFFMFFANILIFSGAEKLPLVQIVLGVVFFLIVAQFMLQTGKDHKRHLNIKTLLPVGTAICWAIFFVGNTWFIKESVMTPVQTVLMTEGAVFVVAVLWYLVSQWKEKADMIESFDKSQILPLALIGFGNVGGNFLFYYGYLDNPANIINFIRLFAIIVTAFLGRWILKDKLTKKHVRLMSLAFVVLIAFVFADALPVVNAAFLGGGCGG